MPTDSSFGEFMMMTRSLLGVAVLTVSLSGCAWFGLSKTENSPAKQREALEIPPDLARPASDDLAALPAEGAATYSKHAAQAPAEKAALATEANMKTEAAPKSVRLERDGALRWLVVQGDPERMWVRAREYFLRNDLKLSVENPKAGILESEWTERPANIGKGFFGSLLSKMHSTGVRDKIRVRVERGRVTGTTEIYVAHQGLEEVVVNGGGTAVVLTAWQPRAADPEMEAEVLNKLLVHFGLDPSQAQNQIASTSAESIPLVKGELILAQDDLDGAWRRVGLALDRAGVTTEDRDRNAGIYYVRYVDSGKAQRRGIFGWLRGDPDKSADVDGKKELPKDRFQIRVKALSQGSSVSVYDVKGEPDTSTAGQHLLSVLQQQLR